VGLGSAPPPRIRTEPTPSGPVVGWRNRTSIRSARSRCRQAGFQVGVSCVMGTVGVQGGVLVLDRGGQMEEALATTSSGDTYRQG
jgi:hypothetical protein